MKNNRGDEGGILLSVLLLFSLMSFIFVQLAADNQIRNRYLKQTEVFYLALSMEIWTVKDLRARLAAEETTLPLVGRYQFQNGQVDYRILPAGIQIEVQVDQMEEPIKNIWGTE